MVKQTSLSVRRLRGTTAKKRQRRPNKHHRATTNLTERTKHSKKHMRKRSCSKRRAQRRAQQGHAHIGQGTWTGTQQEQKKIPRRRRKKRICKAIASSQQQNLSWEVTAGKINLGKGTLGKGEEPGRVCNGASKKSQRGGRRIIRGRKLQTSGKEPYQGESRLVKRK